MSFLVVCLYTKTEKDACAATAACLHLPTHNTCICVHKFRVDVVKYRNIQYDVVDYIQQSTFTD